MGNKFLFIFILSFIFSSAFGQKQIDSALIKQYPFKIGNIGFAVDSLEIFVGDILKVKQFTTRLKCTISEKNLLASVPARSANMLK